MVWFCLDQKHYEIYFETNIGLQILRASPHIYIYLSFPRKVYVWVVAKACPVKSSESFSSLPSSPLSSLPLSTVFFLWLFPPFYLDLSHPCVHSRFPALIGSFFFSSFQLTHGRFDRVNTFLGDVLVDLLFREVINFNHIFKQGVNSVFNISRTPSKITFFYDNDFMFNHSRLIFRLKCWGDD